MDGCPQVLKQEVALAAAFAKRRLSPDRGEAESQDQSRSKAVCGDSGDEDVEAGPPPREP